jgi:hypothetical protein
MTLRKYFQLTANLMLGFVLLAPAALLHPSGIEEAQAERPAAPLSSNQASLEIEAPSGTIYYVKKDAPGPHTGASWANAFTNVQEALDMAASADQIWVASGIYTPTHQIWVTDTRSATFLLLEGVEIYGSFKGNETSLSQRDWRNNISILSGDLNGNDVAADFPGGTTYAENSYHVVTADYLNQPTRLDGFIIQGGNANLPIEPFNYGGGFYNRESAVNLANLIFYKNYGRQGGGLYNVQTYSMAINCAWIGNKSNFGGGLRNIDSDTHLINTVFVGNSAYRAGAIYNSLSNPTIVNTTIAYNQGDDAFPEPIIGGILNDQNAHPTLLNSILWGNYPSQIYNESITTPTVITSSVALYHSLIQGGWNINGTTCIDLICLDADPKFVNAPGADTITGTLDDNLRLSWSSPAINAGDNNLLPIIDQLDINYNGITNEPLPFDLDNTGRFNGPKVDLGAYEVKILFLPLIRR